MSKSLLAVVMVIITTFFWGTNFNAGKLVVSHIMPLTASAMRYVLAALVLLAINLPHLKLLPGAFKNNMVIFILLGVIGVAGFNGLFLLGLKYTSPINGALIMATNPLITTLLAVLVLKEPIHLHHRIGMLISLLGVIIVITHGSWDALSHFRINIGDGIIFAANFCWASYGVLNRRYVKYSSALLTTTSTMLLGAALLVLAAGFEPHGYASALHQPWYIYALIVYMAIGGSAFAYLFWNYSIEQLGPSRTSLFFNLVPVFTVLVSIITGTPLNGLQLFGGALVIFGVFISMSVSQKDRIQEV